MVIAKDEGLQESLGLVGHFSVDGGVRNWELRRPFNFRRLKLGPFRTVTLKTLLHMADSVKQVVNYAYEVLAMVDDIPDRNLLYLLYLQQ